MHTTSPERASAPTPAADGAGDTTGDTAGAGAAHPADPAPDAPRGAAVARWAQLGGLVACGVLLPVLMGRFWDLYRSAAADKLPRGTAGQLDVAAWAAWATSWLFNGVAYGVLALALGALGAACCRWAGATGDFRGLRWTVGAVAAGYLALRLAVFLVLSLAGADDRALLDWLSASEPSLLLLWAATAVVLRRAAPELRPLHTAWCAGAPALLLGALFAVL
ncbi:hypothetical protein ACO0M4_19825 [Streptomyces sp. RGM 3693]|uniref:hypothetical protein n=1 Tax=Streptomyces sp. RGM 3693 TaxID=3413284 RepID=UPI003D2766BC